MRPYFRSTMWGSECCARELFLGRHRLNVRIRHDHPAVRRRREGRLGRVREFDAEFLEAAEHAEHDLLPRTHEHGVLGGIDIEDQLEIYRRRAELEGVDSVEGREGLAFDDRSEEHTSELQSLMRISYAVFCLKKKKHKQTT